MDDPRRRAKRHRVESLTCDLGEVLDLSACGMRVSTSGKPPFRPTQITRVRLRVPEGVLAVDARVVWIRRCGLRKYQSGIEFVNVKKAVSTALDRLAQFGFVSGAPAPSASHEDASARSRRRPARVRASIDLPDYYGVLGVGPSATVREIRDAFRQLARQHHPDVSDDPQSATQFMKIHEAYEVLRDGPSRRSYDQRRAG